MGICVTKGNNNKRKIAGVIQNEISQELKKGDIQNKSNQIIQKEGMYDIQIAPKTKKEIDELYSYESALCKIRFETLKNGEKAYGVGTGFFCEIKEKDISFNKALFTNNHVLNENSIKINKKI